MSLEELAAAQTKRDRSTDLLPRRPPRSSSLHAVALPESYRGNLWVHENHGKLARLWRGAAGRLGGMLPESREYVPSRVQSHPPCCVRSFSLRDTPVSRSCRRRRPERPPISRGTGRAGALGHVMVSKDCDHLPLTARPRYMPEPVSRSGSLGTLANGSTIESDAAPLVDACGGGGGFGEG